MRFSEEGTIFTIGLLSAFTFFLLLVLTESWGDHQIRVMYQTTYQKNIECRVAYKDRDPRYIENVCGKLPVFEDYKND